MANRLHGEVAVTIGEGGEQREVIFRLGINEMIGLQDALGLSSDDERFFGAIERPRSLIVLRTMVKWALRYGQPDITDEQAGEIITELGVPAVRRAIDETVTWALPDPVDTPAGGPKGKGVAASPGRLPS